MEFKIDETFSSTLQRVSRQEPGEDKVSIQDLWKDSQSLSLNFSYPLSQKVSFEPVFTSRILTDPFARLDNDFQFYSGSAQINFQPLSNIKISPRVGSKWQTQISQSDQGFGYGGEATVDNFDLFGYESDFSLLGQQDFFPKRRNEDLRLRYNIKRQFYESTADTLIIIFDRLRRDTFSAANVKDDMGMAIPDSIEIFVRNLATSNQGFENRLSYKVGANTLFFLRSSVFSSTRKINNLKDETIDVRTDDSGFESQNTAKLNIQKPRWFTEVNWNYYFRSRDERRPAEAGLNESDIATSLGFDEENIITGLGLRGGYRIDTNDSLGVSASISKAKRTTTSSEPADHDQIKWQFTLAHAHQFSKSLRLVWRGSAFLNHFVYISSKRSASNNWERFIQLKPEVVYQPSKRLSIHQAFTVRAKYQTFDFKDVQTIVQDNVIRWFIVSNRTRFALTPTSSFELEVNLELSEQGRFFVEGWRQGLALSLKNQELNVRFRQQIGENLYLSSGLNFLQKLRWEHKLTSEGKLEKSLRSKQMTIGPLLTITFQPSSSLEVLFFGNIDVVHSSGNSTVQINNFNLDLNWFF